MEVGQISMLLVALLVVQRCSAAPEGGRLDEECGNTTCIPEECELMGSVCVENSCGQLECVSQTTAHHSGMCPYLGSAPDEECPDNESETTCDDLGCQKEGKVCCPDRCGYLHCV
ncbi:uncharacterized protein LOC125757778 [Rhipicephalus sanguineus]|uniref:Uncharacterized protein n=1 Tax=Rhipicephalus sanguineus TaxID=34632 RepID=A0A9D4Q445_RHISA|nr:uncharacterized protein LOC125757778 [Rhipicephalus sanguineus]KAH7962681.1 hypothetical protein HPB52_017438 [Rhipicephalus sanguineus]